MEIIVAFFSYLAFSKPNLTNQKFNIFFFVNRRFVVSLNCFIEIIIGGDRIPTQKHENALNNQKLIHLKILNIVFEVVIATFRENSFALE